MSACFSDYAGYFCRRWGSNAEQGKTDISEDDYMLCVGTTTAAPDSEERCKVGEAVMAMWGTYASYAATVASKTATTITVL